MDIPRSISIPPQITYAYLLLHVGMSTLFVLWNSKSSEIPLCKEKGIYRYIAEGTKADIKCHSEANMLRLGGQI